MTEIEDFIRRLPKAELHLHLEGSILPSTLVELSTRHDAAPLTLPQAEALYRFHDFTGFLEAFKAVTARLRMGEDYELIAWRMAERLAQQGVVHAEVFFAVGVLYRWHPDEPAILEQVFAGLERARLRAETELGLTLYWIFDAVRHFPPEEAVRVFRKAIELAPHHKSIAAIGLGGDERITGSEVYREIYAEARAAGLKLTNHAGETTGPEAIREALAIGSERLGHVLSLPRDFYLMEELAERRFPLELNPTSNVRTGVCPSWQEHPLRQLFDRGLLVTVNSDDPAFFGSDLEGEYRAAHREQGFTAEELRQLACNSIEASFLPEAEKLAHLARIDSIR